MTKRLGVLVIIINCIILSAFVGVCVDFTCVRVMTRNKKRKVSRYFWKIRTIKQRREVGKYSFVNSTITDYSRLPGEAMGTSHGKTNILKTRVRKVKNSEGK